MAASRSRWRALPQDMPLPVEDAKGRAPRSAAWASAVTVVVPVRRAFGNAASLGARDLSRQLALAIERRRGEDLTLRDGARLRGRKLADAGMAQAPPRPPFHSFLFESRRKLTTTVSRARVAAT